MGLFDLEDFFTSLYAANVAFWDMLAWVASLFTMPDAAARFFQAFLTGAATYGEASQMVSLYEVTDAATVFDTGIQDPLLGGRRRLLEHQHASGRTYNRTTTTGSSRKLMGFKLRLAKNIGR
jgi:hypothetical protein